MNKIYFLYTKDKRIFGEFKYTKSVFSDYTKHFHTHMGLSLIDQGYLEITYDIGSTRILDRHAIAVFNPRQVHKSRTIDAEGYYVLFLNNTWCQEIQKDFYFHRNVLRDQILHKELKNIFHRILKNDKMSEIESELKRAMKIFFHQYADKKKAEETELISQIKSIIHTKWHESITAEKLSKYMGYNKSYLIRRFKKEVGMTPQQYILNVKVNHAKGLLNTSTFTSLSDISADAGFFDQSHFNRNFKGLFGESPNKYRKVNFIQDK